MRSSKRQGELGVGRQPGRRRRPGSMRRQAVVDHGLVDGVGLGGDLEPGGGCLASWNFSVGALGLDSDGDYAFIYSAPLPTMDPDEFMLPLHVVARTADQLESEFSAGDDDH